MILDTDNEILEVVGDTNKLVIETVFRNSYESSTSHDKFSVVDGKFNLVFEQPMKLISLEYHTYLQDVTISVRFYRYEYERMLKEGEVIAGRDMEGKLIHETKLVWKTINNFNIKLREMGFTVGDIRDLNYKLYPA